MFREFDEGILTTSTLNGLKNRTQYLNDELILLCLFCKRVSNKTKQHIIYFNLLHTDTTFLNIPISAWETQ